MLRVRHDRGPAVDGFDAARAPGSRDPRDCLPGRELDEDDVAFEFCGHERDPRSTERLANATGSNASDSDAAAEVVTN